MDGQPGTPPLKKRRFFDEPAANSKKQKPLPPSSPPPQSSAPDTPAQDPEEIQIDPPSPEIEKAAPPKKPSAVKNDADGFDVALFASFIGEELPEAAIQKLKQASRGNMERAINMYFDGSWKTLQTQATTSLQATLQTTLPLRNASTQAVKRKETTAAEVPGRPRQKAPKTGPRFIGAFGVEGWATKSGSNLLTFNEHVTIERQKMQAVKSKGKSKASSFTRRKTSDIVVRFRNSKGEEIGRLSQDKAAFISTLMDQKICSFEGICFYAPDRIRTNDTINLQLRCFLLPSAFDERILRATHGNDNRVTDLFAAAETEDEKDLRLRQIALVKLFEEVNLNPIRTNEITAKHKRTGLLQAAEMAEHVGPIKTAEPHEPSSMPDTATQNSDTEDNEGKELEQDQLDALYRKAQSFDWDSPESEPADTFVLGLRRYQKQALHWLLNKEKDIQSRSNGSMHPLWEEFLFPTKDENGIDLEPTEGQDKFYVNPYSGDLSLTFPRQEQNCRGGILADEMGLGKTIEMLSLVHSHKSELAPTHSTNIAALPKVQKASSEVEFAPCTTLVVAPMSLLAQWQSEAEKASKPGTMKTLIYYGADKNVNLQMLCSGQNAGSAPNLVITSYGTVLSEFNSVVGKGGNRGESGGLFSVKFFRIILDEGHYIKNRVSKTAKACYELSAEHRWILTGTPIVNRLEDLFSLVRFLRVEPWSNFSFWRTFITVPFESKDFIRALDVVQTVLEPLVLRRTKEMKQPDGTPLVPLPQKTIIIEEVELSKQEREVYDHIFMKAKRTFAANVEAGTVMKSYTTIFAQILRLRQSCCHPVLVRKKEVVADEIEENQALDASTGFSDDMDLQVLIEKFQETEDTGEKSANVYGAHVLKQIQDEVDAECPICTEEKMVDMVVTGCFHATCKKCLLDHIEYQKERHKTPLCVTCREPINERDIFEVIRDDNPPPPPTQTQPPTPTTPFTKTPKALEPPPPSPPPPPPSTNPPTTPAQPPITLRRLTSRSSAKVESLLTHLKLLRQTSPHSKSTIFSQFTSFLDLIQPLLARNNIPFLRFDGTLTQSTRSAILAKFHAHAGFTVLLLSLRAGGVGLNLTHANTVFMMDPWWSFAVEAQAIDRVHRMGQTEEVRVVRFVVRDSVEERMVRKIQARKRFIASSLGMMTDEEKREKRIEDIKDLLS
ncbi:SNF2 family N-terminal domain-containing protein [Peziza echinospora]|nr:SNF2 family N-terminal domain-containing protein [Peziza echinospora]